MISCNKLLINENDNIKKAVNIIDQGQYGIAIVTDSSHVMKGIITDVDIRKAIVQNIGMNEKVYKIMVTQPLVAFINESREAIFEKMRSKSVRQIPVLDDNGRILGIEIISNSYEPVKTIKNRAVIMAGGMGKRLLPLTKNTPKPMLTVGNEPILGIALSMLRSYGFSDIYVMVHHLPEQIETYVNNFDNNLQIRIIKEDKPLGTCGALSLLPKHEFQDPFVVMNADMITNINLAHLLDYHDHEKVNATICVKDQDFELPYGVVEMENHFLKSIEEKPILPYYVNTGIYVLNPSVLQYIPDNSFFYMTDLFTQLLEKKKQIACFPVREFWMDVGKKEDYHRAQNEYKKILNET